MAKSRARLKVNDHEVLWTEDSRRVGKDCHRCGMPTRGRAILDGAPAKAACIGCAWDMCFKAGRKSGGG